MHVECRFFGPFREAVGTKTVEFETDADTYGELLEALQSRYPTLESRLVRDGSLVGEVAVTKNKRNIRHIDGLATPLEDGDVVRMVPSVYGGAGAFCRPRIIDTDRP